MDNRIFNVNGKGDTFLRDVLDLAFRHHCQDRGVCRAWVTHLEKGLILLWSDNVSELGRINKLPAMSAAAILPLVISWLASDDAKKVSTKDWDANADHDGSNSLGWRVYCEDWGNVAGAFGVICAVKPAYLWYGK